MGGRRLDLNSDSLAIRGIAENANSHFYQSRSLRLFKVEYVKLAGGFWVLGTVGFFKVRCAPASFDFWRADFVECLAVVRLAASHDSWTMIDAESGGTIQPKRGHK